MSTPDTDQAAYSALLRSDFRAFSRVAFAATNPGQEFLINWHWDAMCWHLQLAFEREITRLIINVPPRYGKSLLASVTLPAWGLGKDPTLRFMCISYAQPLANKLARDTRLVTEHPHFQAAFPDLRWNPRRNADQEMETTSAGYRYANSITGSLTGRGANILIIDDPMKAEGVMSEAERSNVNETYDGTILSRLDNKNRDVIIIVHQRLHDDDLTGHVRDRDDWVVLDLPAIAPERRTYRIGPGEEYTRRKCELLHAERENRKILDQLKKGMGTNSFAAQYQQAPMPPEGMLIQRQWLHFYAPSERPEVFDEIIQSWDTASSVSATADYSVGMTFGIKNRTAYLLDVVRGRWNYPTLKARVIAYQEQWDANHVLVENCSSGLNLGLDLRSSGELRPLLMKPKGDKVARVEVHTAKIEAGNLRFPLKARWLDDLMDELLRFPSSRHDDQIDALTQFLDFYARRQRFWKSADRITPQPRRSNRFPNGTWHDRVGLTRIGQLSG